MVQYNKDTAKEIERSYITPEMTLQRIRTLEGLSLQSGEHVLDAGCGTGFLAQELAMIVGPTGRVVGVDNSQDMLELATQRCQGLPQVELKKGFVEELPEQADSFDAVTSVQVLLYVNDVPKALSEIHRVLKPGGRIALLDTDWRGTVLNSSDEALTRRMLTAWDNAVPSPNLPVHLAPLLRRQGFTATRVDAIPIINTSYTPDNFAVGALEWIANYAEKQGAVSPKESSHWLADLKSLGENGEFFFCVNRFLFTAVKL
jgi:arsenite methyltransferase